MSAYHIARSALERARILGRLSVLAAGAALGGELSGCHSCEGYPYEEEIVERFHLTADELDELALSAVDRENRFDCRLACATLADQDPLEIEDCTLDENDAGGGKLSCVRIATIYCD